MAGGRFRLRDAAGRHRPQSPDPWRSHCRCQRPIPAGRCFLWWSLHCLLSGQIPWRRLFAAGLATAVCYTGLGVYIVYVMSSSIVSNEAMFGPIGAVFTLITAEIGLAVALQLGAAIGAAIGTRQDTDGHRSGRS